MRLKTALALLILAACTAQPDPFELHPSKQHVFGGDRPAELAVPRSYDVMHPTPLVIVLHGTGMTSDDVLGYFGYEHVADEMGVLLTAPTGTRDSQGRTVWDATDACCDSEGTGVDDVGYLAQLVQEISAE